MPRASTPSSGPSPKKPSWNTGSRSSASRTATKASSTTATASSATTTSPGILTVGGTILGASNTSNPYQYAVTKGGKIVFKDVSRKATANGCGPGGRRARLHRRRRNAGHRPPAEERRHPGGRRSEDDRQRPSRDRPYLRVRHGRRHRHRGDRPAAHDGAVPSPGHDHRGHGPPGRLDRALLRGRRRRATSSSSPRSPSPSRPWPKDRGEVKRGRRFSIVVVAEGAKPLGGENVIKRMVKRAPTLSGLAASGSSSRSRSRKRPAGKRGPSSWGICSGAARPPPPTGFCRLSSGPTPWS